MCNSFYIKNSYHQQVVQTARISLNLSIHFYHLSLLVVLPNCILCLHRADVNKFLQVGQHWYVPV